VKDECKVPLQKTGAGTRSLAILAILTLIMRRRQRGILALEEPETFLFPHAQRRVVDECMDLADQTFITTHSPYVLERIPAEGVGRLNRNSKGQVDWKMLDFSNVKHLNLYSKRIRQSFCEALLGKGVVVVEGDSDRWWIYGTSRIMNRKQWNGRLQEALELQGVSVVNTDANSDLGKTATFFEEAGLSAICVADQVKDDAVVSGLCNGTFAAVFLRHAGLEDVLASQLPLSLVRKCLTSAPHSRAPLYDPGDVANMAEPTVRSTFCDFMIANKGSAQLHEWLMADLDETSIPSALKDIVDVVSEISSGKMAPCRMSLL
jgi:putative ATP-dependent endonuclease of OLD family